MLLVSFSSSLSYLSSSSDSSIICFFFFFILCFDPSLSLKSDVDLFVPVDFATDMVDNIEAEVTLVEEGMVGTDGTGIREQCQHNSHVHWHESPFIVLNTLSRRDKVLIVNKSFCEDSLGYCPNSHLIIHE